MPELGTLNHKQISAFAGLAPINRDGGKSQGKRRILGGQHSVSTTLYMATLSATQCNPVIGGFYRHLVKQGKYEICSHSIHEKVFDHPKCYGSGRSGVGLLINF